MIINDNEKLLQKIFEFIVKHKGEALDWSSHDIRRFIRWALYYRRLFVVWADTREGRRIAALGVAWRTEAFEPHLDDLSFENTEFGNKLFIHQVITHPDFQSTGTLFQLLSLALWRYPEVRMAYWRSEHHSSGKLLRIPIARLASMLASQVNLAKLRPFIRRRSWEERKNPQSQTFK